MVIRNENLRDYQQSVNYNGEVGAIAAQTQMSYSKKGNILIVNFISPTGKLIDQLIRFSIVPYRKSGFDFVSTPTLISVKYFDENGDEINGGMQPELVEVAF